MLNYVIFLKVYLYFDLRHRCQHIPNIILFLYLNFVNLEINFIPVTEFASASIMDNSQFRYFNL